MSLEALHNLSDKDFEAALAKCCGAERWVRLMLAKRPFADRAQLWNWAEKAWFEGCGEADWHEAFTHHPKIGDMENLKKKFAATHEWSGAEQAGVHVAKEEVLLALAEGNRAYEEKFSYIFIVCATGKSAEEMLQLLQSRLPNTPEAEIHIAMGEQHKITLLRLEKLLQDLKVG